MDAVSSALVLCPVNSDPNRPPEQLLRLWPTAAKLREPSHFLQPRCDEKNQATGFHSSPAEWNFTGTRTNVVGRMGFCDDRCPRRGVAAVRRIRGQRADVTSSVVSWLAQLAMMMVMVTYGNDKQSHPMVNNWRSDLFIRAPLVGRQQDSSYRNLS